MWWRFVYPCLLGKQSFLRISQHICALVFLIPIKVCSRSDYQVGHSNKICLIESGICGRGVSLYKTWFLCFNSWNLKIKSVKKQFFHISLITTKNPARFINWNFKFLSNVVRTLHFRKILRLVLKSASHLE